MRVKHSICLALVAAGLPGLAVPQLLAEKALSKKETRKAERMAERKKKGRSIPEAGDKPVIEPLELGPIAGVKNPPPVAINRELALSRQQVQQRHGQQQRQYQHADGHADAGAELGAGAGQQGLV